MAKYKTILEADAGIQLVFHSISENRTAASLVNRGTGKLVAVGFGRRKEQALRDLDRSITAKCPDFYAHCVTRLSEGSPAGEYCVAKTASKKGQD